MCGISGIIQNTPNYPIRKKLAEMSFAIKHRGPDGADIWLSRNQLVGLAHQRLAIVDLSSKANQPMSDKDQTIFVTFNGEIYNHIKLRRELVKLGHKFSTNHSDTEILVHGYKEWGLNSLVNRLDGMFAFAIWDDKKQILLLARDRIGIKPLYFCSHKGSFRFASEIKAILADTDIPREMDPNSLNHYLSFMVAPAPLTLFKGIYKLPAAHIMQVTVNGKMSAQRYWDTNKISDSETYKKGGIPEKGQETFFIEGIRSRFEKAVQKRLMADVPFGVFLSGGIDSSANVAILSHLMDRPLDTFTVGFSDYTHLNELGYAKQISSKFNTNHHEVLIGETDALNYLSDLFHYQDEPIADWVCVPLHFVSELARKAGIKVIQVGEGSDEQFCGYDSWMRYLRFAKFFWAPYTKTVPASLKSMMTRLTCPFAPSNRGSISQLFEAIHRADKGQNLFFSGANAIWNIHKSRYLNREIFAKKHEYEDLDQANFETAGLASEESGDLISGYYDELYKVYPNCDQLTKMAYCEFKLRLPELLLMRLDKISMSHSIEGRVPFLDQSLVEFTMKIPEEYKVRNGTSKYLLKKAFNDLLPSEVINRKKMGFAAPVSQWLKGEFGSLAYEVVMNSKIHEHGYFNKDYIADRFVQHRAGQDDHSLHLWTIFNLVSWYNHWIN